MSWTKIYESLEAGVKLSEINDERARAESFVS